MSESSQAKGRSVVWRWIWLAVAILVLASGVGGFLIWHTEQEFQAEMDEAERRLQAAMAEAERLDGPWRAEDLAARCKLPDDDNAAAIVLAVADKMPAEWPWWARVPPPLVLEGGDLLPLPERGPPPLMHMGTFSGPAPVVLTAAQKAAMRAEMNRAGEALALARRLADRPRGAWPFSWHKNPLVTLQDEPGLGPVGELLSYDAILQAQEGDLHGALGSCRAALNAASAIGDVPTYPAQQTRREVAFRSLRALDHVLAMGEPPIDSLRALQKRLVEEAAAPLLLMAARGERAGFDRLCEGLLSGDISADEWLETRKRSDSKGTPLSRAEKLLITRSRAVLLEKMNQLVEIMKLTPTHQQIERLKELERSMADAPALARVLFSIEGAAAEGPRLAQAQIYGAAVAVAVEIYRQKRGRWPKQLDELVPDFLRDLPTDPYSGAPLHYLHRPDGVTVGGLALWHADRRRQPPK